MNIKTLSSKIILILAMGALVAFTGLWTGGSKSASAEPLTPPAATSSVIGNITFNSDSDDIWGAAADGESWQLIDAQWSEDGSFGSTSDIIGGVDFSFDSNGCKTDLLHCLNNAEEFVSLTSQTVTIGFDSEFGVAGHIKFDAETTNLQGDAAVVYPGTAGVDYPSADSFLAGQTVDVGGSWAFSSNATIDAGESGGDLRLIGDFRVAGTLDVAGHSQSGTSSGEVLDFDGSDVVTLFSLSAFDGTPAIPPLPVIGIGGQVGPFSVTPDVVSVAPSGVITATGTNTFSNFVFDLDKIVATLLGTPSLGENLDLSYLGVPLALGYDYFDADAHVNFTASQTLTFTPSVKIKLSFSPPPSGFTGAFDSHAPDNSWVIFDPEDQIGITFPPGRRDGIEVTPQVLLEGTLRNQSNLGTNSDIELLGLRFDYQIPGFGIFPEIDEFDTGLNYPHPNGDLKYHHGHSSDHWHDGSILGIPCEDCIYEVHTWTEHHDSLCFLCSPDLHNAFIDLHDIKIGPWGPRGYQGLDITQDPVWGPETFAETSGPDTDLADETFNITFDPIALTSFLLEPNDAPLADPGGPYTVDEGSSITLSGALSTDEEGDPMTFSWDLDGNGGFETLGSEVSFFGVDGPVDHTVTLQVCDPYTCNEADVTVHVNNVQPAVEAGDGQTVYRNEVFSVSGSWTDPAGAIDDLYTWNWDLDGDGGADESGTAGYGSAISKNTAIPLEGFYDLGFTVADKDAGIGNDLVTIEVLNRLPGCFNAGPSLAVIQTPNHKMTPINVIGVTDPEGDTIAITITGIHQDEPVSAKGSGNSEPDGSGVGTDTASVRAERAGGKKDPGNGRVYEISFIADDAHGGQCTGVVSVRVPHNQSKDAVAVNDGAVYDSTAP